MARYAITCPLCRRPIYFNSTREAFYALAQHVQDHHPEYQNTCLLCGAKYNNVSNLRHHLLYRHTIVKDDTEGLIKCMQLLAIVSRHQLSLMKPACVPIIKKFAKLVGDDPASGPPPEP